ncbi:hypothetical protein, conserved [Eimeria brunetti]|uniref:Dense granule protein GRA12 n=1 Tax=Eimeria brunetti TaxID=51314 RepID=U6LTJ8_9EIME|nr:hypothetical protein, conserved [Eimeria brunetti]
MLLPRRSVVALAAFLFLLLARESRADVGVASSEGHSVNTTSVLHRQSWILTREGCRVGKAGNLVVTPIGGTTVDGGEALETQTTGPLLCMWLSMMEKAHYEMLATWQEEHMRRKAGVPWWNIFKRLALWRRSFPKLEIEVEIRYLALWNKDKFGHPMPWATAVFRYKCPDAHVSYGLLNHLCGTAFSEYNDPRVGSEVHLLLQPRPGYNRPLDIRASNWQYLTGALSGLRGGRTRDQREREERWIFPESLYSRMNSIMTISGKIDDCWMNEGLCYFKWLLRVEWTLFRETVCERLQRDANSSLGGAFKAAALRSVQVNVTGMDFFNYSRPVLFGVLEEGTILANAGSGFVSLEVDTDPQNLVNFERAKSTSQNVRAAGLVLKGVGKLLGIGGKQYRKAVPSALQRNFPSDSAKQPRLGFYSLAFYFLIARWASLGGCVGSATALKQQTSGSRTFNSEADAAQQAKNFQSYGVLPRTLEEHDRLEILPTA